MWRLLKDHPDRYFYEAVRDGISYDAAQGTALTEQRPLPIAIAAGVDDVSERGGWNEPVGCECALPTETWREHVARRQRYEEVRAKLAAGEVTSIGDIVTYNLDIEKFAQDVIAGSEGPELVRAFWKALRAVSILDPTCGSGAFLFAALNILEPLYNACLDAMRGFLDDLERSGRKHRPEKFSDFREALREVDGHASERYFILKSIIIDNLYGVDVMEEAVEICKLRLFLKLVAQLEDYEQIEPLPDIDFNVRAGNTLVGFASLGEVKRTLDSDMIRRASLTEIGDRIKERAEIASRAFGRFRAMQTEQGMDAAWFAGAKLELRTRLDDLGEELDGYLAGEYGVKGESAFRRWRERHQPFHWFVEFYDVMQRGGFDVIIGNPPWRELTAVKEYTTRGYQTQRCGNLHGLCTERSVNLAVAGGRFSFIVQLPMVSSSRMVSVRDLLTKGAEELYVASFDDRPGKLFDGLQHCRCVVFVARIKNKRSRRAFVLHTSRYQRWHTGMRDGLFQRIRYSSLHGDGFRGGVFPKYDGDLGARALARIHAAGDCGMSVLRSARKSETFVFYQEATQYWTKVTLGLPYFEKNGVVGPPAHGRYIYFRDPKTAHVVCAILNSSTFYSYFVACGDCFHLSDKLVDGFPIMKSMNGDMALVGLNQRLMRSLRGAARNKTIRTRDGDTITYAEYYTHKSKPILDQIDRVLALHYGLSDEEADFIINYDIKYRMGREMLGVG